jgi:hypothetical protein
MRAGQRMGGLRRRRTRDRTQSGNHLSASLDDKASGVGPGVFRSAVRLGVMA